MTKKTLNQNAKYVHELIEFIESNFVFNNKPINRFKITKSHFNNANLNKKDKLSDLKKQIKLDIKQAKK